MTHTPEKPANDAAPKPEDMKDYASEPASPAEECHVDPTAQAMAGLEAEKADLKDKLLRLMAEMENLRRRTEREVADAKAYGVTSFARDMLGAADNLRRALESMTAEGKAALEGPAKALLDGVELTERDFLKTLERHGVRRLEPDGQKFDPNMHQAMFESPHPTVPKGHVMAVVQTGYAIGERVLRPAFVGVSAGPAAS